MDGYLKPKVKTGKLGTREKVNGMFQNIPSYVKLGGFSSSGREGIADVGMRGLSLEKGELTRRGKPI